MNIVPWNPKKLNRFYDICVVCYSIAIYIAFRTKYNLGICRIVCDRLMGQGQCFLRAHNGQLKLTNLWVVWGSSHYKPLTALNVKIKAKISNYEKSSKLWKLWQFFVFPIIIFASLVDSFWDGVFKFELYNDVDLFHTKQ